MKNSFFAVCPLVAQLVLYGVSPVSSLSTIRRLEGFSAVHRFSSSVPSDYTGPGHAIYPAGSSALGTPPK